MAALLPPERPATGRSNRDRRTVLNAILSRLGTGVPWRDLPERYGPWQTATSRFRRCQRAGIWGRLLAALQAAAEARGDVDWTLHFLDGTVVRAQPRAAGPKKGAATKSSAAARAGSRPNSTGAPTAPASRTPSS